MASTQVKTTSLAGGPWSQSKKAAAASLTTALAGANNDLTYTAKDVGASSITVRYVVAGASTPLSVSVSGSDITVNVATNGSSAATSTAAQVKTAVDGNGPASALVSVANASGNDGTGVVTALGVTALTGGVSRKVAHGTNGWGSVKRDLSGRGSVVTN